MVRTVRQEEAAEDREDQHAPGRRDQADTRYLEHSEGRLPQITRYAVDEQVRAGSYERQGSTENRHVGKRYQQPRRHRAEALRQPPHHGYEDDHHRSVIHEGGRAKRPGEHLARNHLRMAFCPLHHSARKCLDRTGPHQRPRQHEQARDGDGCWVGEHPEHLRRA